MIETYQIEKNTSDLNVFTLIIKYIVLFIVIFIASWFILPLFISGNRPSRAQEIGESFFENPIIISVILSTGIISWFIYRAWKKYNYGEILKFDFDESDGKLIVTTINLINNKVKKQEYDYQKLSYRFEHAEDPLIGKQRIIKILFADKIVHDLNIERTAWCRNPRIEKLIEKIKTGHNRT